MLNPKPPDPEAAFAFPANVFPAEIPEKSAKARAASNLEAKPMSRTTSMLTRSNAAAFDFDVVSDVSRPPARKPDPVPEPTPESSAAGPETLRTVRDDPAKTAG